LELVQELQENIRPYLSAATRQAFGRGKEITLRTDNYLAFADEHRWTTVQEKSRKILEYIRVNTRFYSEIVYMDPTVDYPLFDAITPKECEALTQVLNENGFISRGASKDGTAWTLTMAGWDKLEPLRSGGVPGRCFVAMAFDLDLDDAYYQGIKPAISDCGYDPICLKDRLPNDNICDVIMAEIRKAQFVVADFTKQKGGVYFEAGFAKALGKEVFWTCREDDFGRLHFDTNHYGHLKWTDPAHLKKLLGDSIIAELGFGPHRHSNAETD
jgi:hypothetical protein